MSSPSSRPRDRPPRASTQAACIPCRRRKSRCKFEPAAQECLMCRTHQTQCIKPPQAPRKEQRQRLQRAAPTASTIAGATPAVAITTPPHSTAVGRSEAWAPAEVSAQATQRDGRSRGGDSAITPFTPSVSGLGFPVAPEEPGSAVSLDTTEEDNPHIVGPATASDSHFLEDYLSSINARDGGRTIRPVLPGVTSAPVVFMKVKKRPIGLSMDPNPSSAKLEMITKLLEPHHDALIRTYFARVNSCFPILHEDSLKQRSLRSVSPAVLACLYAHTMCYWNYDAELQKHRRPDGRFIWNLALEALYSELHISQGMPCIISILLNIGGRPTTTMVGNGMLLGCAVSLAQSLGLNRNPVSWGISEQEKTFRMQIWWCLVIQDRWTSLTHGTPPHIRQSHHDVPVPTTTMPDDQATIFKSLASLTTVLGFSLEQLYSIRETARDEGLASRLALDLDAWTDTLVGETRRIIIRGTNLDVPGAANLRLCYLAARFFSYRLELSGEVDDIYPGQPPNERLLRTRRSIEDIVMFVHELSVKQLGDFWLPTAAFVFSLAATFLVRLAIQIEIPMSETPTQSRSLTLAHDLISSLRLHKDVHGWELGDICLSQYGDVIDKLWCQNVPAEVDMTWLNSASFIPDPFLLDSIVTDQGDPLAWYEQT